MARPESVRNSGLSVPSGPHRPRVYPPVAEVPVGTVDEVLAWVDGDAEKAERALAAEEAGKGRVTLIDTLTDILIDATEPESADTPEDTVDGDVSSDEVSVEEPSPETSDDAPESSGESSKG